jgi:predicted small metal-binding protein
MPRVIRCECGYVARGEDDEALLADAKRHIEADHVELVDQLSRDDLLAMAEEE